MNYEERIRELIRRGGQGPDAASKRDAVPAQPCSAELASSGLGELDQMLAEVLDGSRDLRDVCGLDLVVLTKTYGAEFVEDLLRRSVASERRRGPLGASEHGEPN